MPDQNYDRSRVVELLNQILEEELAGVVRYTHYSFMVFGYSRIPIVSWFREQADESMMHAQQAGELLTSIGEHPSLGIGQMLETHRHDIGDILREALENERKGLELYRQLLEVVEGKNIALEEYARKMVAEEQMHLWEVDKMLRKPGDIESFVQQQKTD